MDVLQNQVPSWMNFLPTLQLRFGPSHFDDHQGTLFNIIQTTTFANIKGNSNLYQLELSESPTHFFYSLLVEIET